MRKMIEFKSVCDSLSVPFSTEDVIVGLKRECPEVWGEFVALHGEGGSGCGRQFSAFSLVASQIPRYGFHRSGWMPAHMAQHEWGSGVVALWERCH